MEKYTKTSENNKFSQNCPKFHIFTKIILFFKYNCNFFDQLLLPYKYHSRYYHAYAA